MNFHIVVPYLELLARNGLAERTEGGVPRYEATARGAKRSAFQGAEGAECFSRKALDSRKVLRTTKTKIHMVILWA
jgi:hypothetical protein